MNDSFDLTFTLPGDPKSKERPRMTRQGRAYTPKATKEAEAAIKEFLLENVLDDRCPYGGPLGISLRFYTATLRRSDLDNKIKLLTDAMNKLVYDDDCQLDEIHARIYRKHLGEEPRTEVHVYAL
jgi:Holliday junction resolvase RusA-like endonuclease